MLYFTGEVFRRLANQNRGHTLRLMLKSTFFYVFLCFVSGI